MSIAFKRQIQPLNQQIGININSIHTPLNPQNGFNVNSIQKWILMSIALKDIFNH